MGRTYTNLPIDFQEQLSKLKSYGLLVKDEDSAIRDLHSFNLTPNINLKSMGFPANWQDELLWK